MDNFTYSQPVKIYFGCGNFKKLDEILRELGLGKCIIACDKIFLPMVKEIAKTSSSVLSYYGEIEENPQISGAIEVAKLANIYNADAIIGLGGGSSIDTAKFAAAICKGDSPALDYYNGLVPFPEDRLTVIAVPTTSGTGSEVTQVSVMNNGKEKKTINNPVFMPKAAIVDPELCLTVPPRVTMNTGLDALAHALEGYWSKNHQPISDLMAIEAVRIILSNLEKAYLDGKDIEARSNMAYAATLAGLAFALPKTAGSHACSYPLSEDYHLPHGEACAFTLDSFVRINEDDRLNYLCNRAGLDNASILAEKIVELKKLAGLKMTLSDLGEVDMDKLVHDASIHPLMNNNPVKMDENKLREMFEALR